MRLCGGAKLAAWLVAEIDELILQITPVLIGSAIRVAGMRLIRFRGHFPKGGYDVHDGGTEEKASASQLQ